MEYPSALAWIHFKLPNAIRLSLLTCVFSMAFHILSAYFWNGLVRPVVSSLDELELVFEDYGFFRCHQSYLIPLEGITALRASSFGQTYEAVIGETHVIPVSRSRFARLREELSRRGIRFL